MQLVDDFLHLLYPSGCFVCEKELSKFENHLCSFCLEKISLTNFHLFEDATSMDKLFWGRIKINKSYSHLFFEKNKVSQSILFSLKYKNNPSIAARTMWSTLTTCDFGAGGEGVWYMNSVPPQ